MGQEATISAGSIDISPQRPLPLAGFEGRLGPSEGTSDPLELNGLLIRTMDRTLAILTADLLFVTDEIKHRILADVGAQLSLSESSLLIAASHTHFAPAVDASKPRLGMVDPQYADFVAQQGANLFRQLAASVPIVARMTYARARADHAINRRRRGWRLSRNHLPRRCLLMAPNPAGPRDEALHLIVFADRQDRPVAVIWSYACHPVVFPAAGRVSAEYPGVVRRALRAALAPGIPVLFLQGFAGDIRPREVGTPATFGQFVNGVLCGPLFAPVSWGQYEAWSNSLAERVVHLLRVGGPTEFDVSLTARRITVPLDALMDGASNGRSVTFQRLSMHPDLHIVGVSAEPVTEYVAALRPWFRGNVLPVGCIDTVYGYLPTSGMLCEGGYEDSGFQRAFSLPGRFRPTLDEVVRDAFAELSNDAVV